MDTPKYKYSPFSVILIMIAISVIGIALLPMLNLQYKPSSGTHTIDVNYSYPGASAEIIEGEVTSKIEGVLSTIENGINISSVSRKGSGSVIVEFQKNTNMSVARFEVASAIRNIYPSLPDKVTYPVISLDASGNKSTTAVAFILKGDLPSSELVKYAENHIINAISAVDGVDKVTISGGTPYEWVVTYNSNKAEQANISASDIADAFRNYFSEDVIGTTETSGEMLAVRLGTKHSGPDFGDIPIKSYHGRIICLKDLATWRYQESTPNSYHRINGLNTITLAIGVANTDNLLVTVSGVKKAIERLQKNFPNEITVSLEHDSSEYVREELNKIFLRTALCLLILLLFIYLTNRSIRYLFVIFATLVVNILMALAIYSFTGIQIHIYTLAGITVSLGIIIDTTIVMADHYRKMKDRRAFGSLLAAIGTTVVALLFALLLPEQERLNLMDFIYVIIVNLSLSLVVSYFFVPALLDVSSVELKETNFKRKRLYAKIQRVYLRYINWGIANRWVLVLAFIIAFGIPTFLLPKGEDLANKKDKTTLDKVTEKVVNWPPYKNNREDIDNFLGSSFRLFYKSLSKSNFYREPQKAVLNINAGLSEGCTVHQLNEVVKSMENYLSQFNEIETFITSITGYNNANILVYFKPEFENTGFPASLKAEVTRMAANFGGANWRVTGVDDNYFNNNIVTNYKSHKITLTGYNFQDLCKYAHVLIEYLGTNSRVRGTELWGAGYSGRPVTEFNLDYNFERMAILGINPQEYYSALGNRLYSTNLTPVMMDGNLTDVVLQSSSLNSYDLWHIQNSPINIDSTSVILSDIGSIEKRLSGINISKKNQTYEINVAYDFIGSDQLAQKVTDNALKYMNTEVLPIGYKADTLSYGWFDKNKEQYAWLILLIILSIYVILAITFNSLRMPFAVIFMIPISFIGLFLIFGISDVTFDQGGFAAFVMLCGIVVNAGIYITDAYIKGSKEIKFTLNYLHAFCKKITPISLTIISTVLGLIPFLTDGPSEVFWFNFAIGTMGGLFFSIFAIIFYLPVFIIKRK